MGLVHACRPDQQGIVQHLDIGKQNRDDGRQDHNSRDAEARAIGLGPPERKDHRHHQGDAEQNARFARSKPINRGAEQGCSEGDDQTRPHTIGGDHGLAAHRVSDHDGREIGHEHIDGYQDDIGVSRALMQSPRNAPQREAARFVGC